MDSYVIKLLVAGAAFVLFFYIDDVRSKCRLVVVLLSNALLKCITN